MARANGGGLLRDRNGQQQVSPLELFFDLVYVFAVTRLSHGLIDDLDWPGAFQTLLLFMAVWTAWVYTAWVTNWFEPNRLPVRLMIIAVMLGSLVMSAVIPDAFGERGLVFAAAFISIQIGRTLFAVLATRGHELRPTFGRMLFWNILSAIPWVAGALADDETRIVLWTLAVVLEYMSAWLGHATPGLGRTSTSEWTISGEHLTERFRLFFIIALGESLLITGATFADGAFDTGRSVAFIVAFASTVALWWIYFHYREDIAVHAIESSSDPGLLGRLGSYTLGIMVAGVIVAAVGDELVIAHPSGHTEPAWIAAIVGGPALFLIGQTLFIKMAFGRVPRSRLMGLLILAIMAPVMAFLPPLAVAIATTGVLLGIAAADTVLGRAGSDQRPSLN